MTEPMKTSLAPDRYTLWQPPAGRCVETGADCLEVPLPDLALPIHVEILAEGTPSDHDIGQGAYDYLRQFPDCPGNVAYAELLRDAYPHFLSDLASHAVMLDAKEVEPAYVQRKLSYLKILALLEPTNVGLLAQLCRGYYELALTFSELHSCRYNLLQVMRFGQALLKVRADDPATLNLLAEVDLLFGDYPAAAGKWQRLLAVIGDEGLRGRIQARMAPFVDLPLPESSLVDDLESVDRAMQCYLQGDYPQATELLERLEEGGRFQRELPSADFHCLLGLCRLKTADRAGAFAALSTALEIDPDHAHAREALDAFHDQEGSHA